jgi:DNA-binding transcriptional MerR regulator
MIDNDNDAGDFGNMGVNLMHVPESTAYIFTFEINNAFKSYNAYGSTDDAGRIRMYSFEKVYFIQLIRVLLNGCGLKEAKDLVENGGQPHVRARDPETGEDWHIFTVRINNAETAMRIMCFLLKIITAHNRDEAMRTELNQNFNIRNVKMQTLKNLDYFTIG